MNSNQPLLNSNGLHCNFRLFGITMHFLWCDKCVVGFLKLIYSVSVRLETFMPIFMMLSSNYERATMLYTALMWNKSM